jgi:hypothetical protein
MKIAFIQLARAGDCVTILPVAKYLADRGHEIVFYTHVDFMGILEACSYVKVRPMTTTHRDVEATERLAMKEGHEKVICCQVNGNDKPPPLDAENFILQQWVRAGYLEKFHDLPLVFDKRWKDDEAKAIAAHVPQPNGRPLLAFNLESHSSPYPSAAANQTEHRRQVDRIISEYGRDYRLMDLGAIRLARPHLLLGLIECADVLLTVDTLTLHLAYATNTPTVAMSVENPWYQSEPRKHWIAKLTYPESLSDAGRKKIRRAIENREALRGKGACCRKISSAVIERLNHIVGYFQPPQGCRDWFRVNTAHRSWEMLRNQEHHYFLKIVETERMSRTSKTIGDPRGCAFVKDVFDKGIIGLADTDIAFYTNGDICIVPEAAKVLRDKMRDQQCCFSRRVDVSNADKPLSRKELEGSHPHCGTDLFAFRVGWWKSIREAFPDLLLGCEGWDFILRHTMLAERPDAEIRPSIIYHERHQSFWSKTSEIVSNPGQVYARRLCKAWASANGFEDALLPEGVRAMFKADEMFKGRKAPNRKVGYAAMA